RMYVSCERRSPATGLGDRYARPTPLAYLAACALSARSLHAALPISADQREPPRFCCNLASISLALRWFSGLAASRRTIWIALTAAALFIALPNIPIEHSSACRSEPYFHDTDARKHRRGTAAGGTGPFGWNAPVRAAQFAESATRLFGNFQPGRGKWQVYPFGYRWR